jgi:hypothetical protein
MYLCCHFHTWKKLYIENDIKIRPFKRSFEAVNGSIIACRGSVVLKMLIFGETKNYLGKFRFYIVENLAIGALLGIDELFRHEIKVDVQEGFCSNDQVGKLIFNLIYKEPYDIGVVLLNEDIEIGPLTTRDVKVIKTNYDKHICDSIFEPKMNLKEGIVFCKMIVNNRTNVAIVVNKSNNKLNLAKGEIIGNLFPGSNDSPMGGVLEGFVEGEEEEKEADMLDMGLTLEEDDQFESCDFGLNEGELTEDQKVRKLVLEYSSGKMGLYHVPIIMNMK